MSDEQEQVEQYIGCVDWGEEDILSVKRQCVECSRAIALAAHNIIAVAERDLKPICLECIRKNIMDADADWEYGGGLIAGQVVDTAESGLTKERVEQYFKNIKEN